MKKHFILNFFFSILLFQISTSNISAQEIVEDQTDEFTKNVIKRTSWEKLAMDSKIMAYFRFSKINNNLYFDLKIGDGSVFSIDKGQEFMFKSIDGDVIKIQNAEYKLTCAGCAAIGVMGSSGQGIMTSYLIDNETAVQLKSINVEKVRVYTSKGYFDVDLKSKNSMKINQSLNLIF